MNGEAKLRRQIKLLTWFFIVGLVLSGVTAIPLTTELDCLVNLTGARELVATPGAINPPVWAIWLVKVQSTLRDTGEKISHALLRHGLVGFRSFRHRHRVRRRVARSGAQSLALRLRPHRVRAGNSLRADLRRRARDSVLVAAD